MAARRLVRWFPSVRREVVIAIALALGIGCTDEQITETSSTVDANVIVPSLERLPLAAAGTVTRVTITPTDTLRIGPVGGTGTFLARAWVGTTEVATTIKWWIRQKDIASIPSTECTSPCSMTVKGLKVGTAFLDARDYKGGDSPPRDNAIIKVTTTAPPPPDTTSPPDTTPQPPPPPSGDVAVLLAAGDIAHCSNSNDEATAKLLDGVPGATVATLGDNVYEDGTASEYANCYGPTWGRHKARTRPSPGNHEYHTSGASGYYGYFGAAAGEAGKGYYSYDLGSWHIIALNSSISMSAGSAQEKWLRADLAANPKQCTLAYWHYPRFSSGDHGNSSSTQPLWQALYEAGAEIVLSSHDHSYERFAPQTPSGAADPTRGIREFVVGTGGRSHYAMETRKANSEVFNGATYGVLKLTLGAGTYSWEFLPVAGQTFTDKGSASCHGQDGGTPTPPPPSDTTTSPPGTTSLDVRVAASSDDAEESATGAVALSSSDLELVFDGSDQTMGMRFNAVRIPRGATITNAHLQFQVDETNSVATSLTIRGQAADNAATFTTATGNVSSRARTTSAVSWAPSAWTTVGQVGSNQRTPSLAAIIQEIVNRPGWASGNALALTITGTGERTAEAYDGVPSAAPLLHVDYSTGSTTPPTNSAPTASNVTITGTPQVGQVLTGNYTYSDADGDPQGASTYRWLRNGAAISGAAAKTYTLGAADQGAQIVFEVKPMAASGTSPGTAVQSAAVGPVAAESPTTPPPSGSTGGVFPGAEGFGSTTPAGRGGQVLRVTNLNDDGTGSLRAALAASGPRVVVFEVSGTITARSNLEIDDPYITVAGQTAPSPGITIRGGGLRIATHDVLVQHLRIRPGDGPEGPSPGGRDALQIYGSSVYNVVVDHVSASWGIDENSSTSTAGTRHDITISNSIISEGLNNSLHDEGSHSKGLLAGQGTKRISVLRSLFAHNVDRNPYFKGGTSAVFVNNVVYNWGNSKATFFDSFDSSEPDLGAVVGNVYLYGANTPSGAVAIKIYDQNTGSRFYVADNRLNRAAPPSNPWSLVVNNEGSSVVASSPPIWPTGLTPLGSGTVESYVLAYAGARPADRDQVDARVTNGAGAGTGRIIDSPSQVGGWPTLAQNTRAFVTPANPSGDNDGDGYTNLEEVLHQMAATVEGR